MTSQKIQGEIMDDKENINVTEEDDINYIFDDEVIDDSLCPKCMEKITDKTEFCHCGFYVQAAKNATKASIAFISLIIIIIISIFITQTNLLPSIGIKAAHKINKKKMSSFTSPVIQVENNLKNTGLKDIISNLYQKDINNKNILIVVIKQDYWPTMKPEAKQYVLLMLENYWKDAYKGKDPQVRFANPD